MSTFEHKGIGPTFHRESAGALKVSSGEPGQPMTYPEKITNVCVEVPKEQTMKVLRILAGKTWLAAEIQYSNCTNYEGRKILVLNMSLIDFINAKYIDPHFSESSPLIARFIPNQNGWALAVKLIGEN